MLRLSVSSILWFTYVRSFSPSPTFRYRSIKNSPNRKVVTPLNYVQTDETLEERLKEVKQQWDSINSSGLKNFFMDEILSAEKNVQTAIQSAEKAVESALSAKFSELTASNGMISTMKAAEIVADAAATSAKADAMGVNDLAIASKDVVESIKASERAVQSVIDKISAESSNVDATDVESLEKAATDLMKAMETAQSIALNVGQSAAKDASSLQKLESVGLGLLKELDYVEKLAEASLKNEAARAVTLALGNNDESLKNSFQGDGDKKVDATLNDVSPSNNEIAEGQVDSDPIMTTDFYVESDQIGSLGQAEDVSSKIASNQNIVEDLENASRNVVDEMQAVENTAKSVAKIAQTDAKAVSSMQTETNEIVDSIRSFESSIEEAAKNPSLEFEEIVKNTATKTLELIKTDEENAKLISELVTKDAQLDEIAAESIQRADKDIDDLVNAAEAMLSEKVSDPPSLKDIEELAGSISETMKVAENVDECKNCAEIAMDHPLEQVIGSVVKIEPFLAEQSIVPPSDSFSFDIDSVPVSDLLNVVKSEELVSSLSFFF